MRSLDVAVTGVIADLLEVARADTAFADLYHRRARALASAQLGETRHLPAGHPDLQLASVMLRVRNAVDERDWRNLDDVAREVSDSSRGRSEHAAARTAERLHALEEPVDPFSPGTSALAGIPERELPALRDATVERLSALRSVDPGWAELYGARRDALRRLGGHGHAAEAPTGPPAPVLTHVFTRDTCDRAATLGLVPHRVESAADEITAHLKPRWGVAPGEPAGESVRVSVTIPEDAEEALRSNLVVFMNRIFVTSAGTRYLPWCVAEDLLVEAFDEPAAGAASEPIPSPLLAALGLPRRAGLARGTIEKALVARGADVVADLGLDPREFRIVCVPADVYTRLGAKLGWGRRQLWTHFDGYVAAPDRKLLPLAGGDVRYGGLHDVVAVGAGYDSDRLIARFAVVQRRRFAAW